MGIGMGKGAVISGIKQAVGDGFLIEEKDESDKGRVKKYYGLKMLLVEGEEGQSEQGYDNRTPGVRQSDPRGAKVIHRSEKDTLERHLEKNTVSNGIELLRKNTPDLDQPGEKTQYVTDYILEQLGDKQSEKFYRLVAAKVPEDTVRQMLSEVRADGAEHPAKVFTHKVKVWAVKQQVRSLAAGMSG